MRLHPVKDGVAAFDPSDRAPVTTRDRYGQKLVDRHDANGFCTGATSPMTASAPVEQPGSVSGTPNASTPNIIGVTYGETGSVYYDAAQVIEANGQTYGLVIRTVEMGDRPLPVSRVKVTKQPSDADEAVRAAVRAMGYHGKVTKGMRQAILDMLALEVRHVADNG